MLKAIWKTHLAGLVLFCLGLLLISTAFSAPIIEDIESSDGREYVVHEGLEDGVPLFTDRDFSALQVPDVFKGVTYVQTAYDSKVEADLEVNFKVTAPCHVYISPRQGIVELDWLKNDYELVSETMMYKRAAGDRVLEIWKSKSVYAAGDTVTTYETNNASTFYTIFAMAVDVAAVEYSGKLATSWGCLKSSL